MVHLPTDATRKVEKVMTSPITDPTGLFSEDYFKIAVETRSSAARRHLRPVAIVLFDVMQGVRIGSPTRVAARARGEGDPHHAARGGHRVPARRRPLRLRARGHARGRRDLDRRALPSPRSATRTGTERDAVQTRWAGIACYPAHAFSASETLAKAQAAFEAAKDWPQDRIEVATVTDLTRTFGYASSRIPTDGQVTER